MTARLLALGFLLAGCATSAPSRTALMRESGAVVSAEALRIRLGALAPPAMARIEAAADAVRRASDDPRVQRAAVAWKIDVVSALFRDLYSPYPMAGLLDAWAMAIQAQDLLARPSAPAGLGPATGEAVAALRELEGALVETFRWAQPGPDTARVRAELARWAAAHPVAGSLATRRSLREDLAARTAGEELSGFAAAAGALEDLQGIAARMDVLPTLLPRVALWEAELAYRDAGAPRVEQALERADAVLARTDRLLRWLGEPGLGPFAAAEREALIAAVDRQRVAAGELLATERAGLEAFVEKERRAVLEELRRERLAAVADLRALGAEATDRAARSARDLADHLLLRAGLLAAGAILLWGAVAFRVRRAARR